MTRVRQILVIAWRFFDRWFWVFCGLLAVNQVITGSAFGAAVWAALFGIEFEKWRRCREPKGSRVEITYRTGDGSRTMTGEVSNWREIDIHKAYGGTD